MGYTEDQTQLLRERLNEGSSYDEIAEELGIAAANLRSKARRMRQSGEWEEDMDSVRVMPTPGMPGRPRNRERPTQLGARLSPDAAEAFKLLAAEADIGIGALVSEAVWVCGAAEELAEEYVYLAPKMGKGQVLVCTPRSKQLSAQVPESTSELLIALAEKEGMSPSSQTCAVIHAMLEQAGYVLEGRNV